MQNEYSPEYAFEDLSPSSLQYSKTYRKELPKLQNRISCELVEACAAIFRKQFVVKENSIRKALDPKQQRISYFQALPQLKRVVKKSKAASRYFQRKCKSSQGDGIVMQFEQPETHESNSFRSRLKSYTLTKWLRNYRVSRSIRHTDTTHCQQLTAKGLNVR